MYSSLDFPNGLGEKKSNQYTLILLVSEVQSSQGIISCEKPLLQQLVFEIFPSSFVPSTLYTFHYRQATSCAFVSLCCLYSTPCLVDGGRKTYHIQDEDF